MSLNCELDSNLASVKAYFINIHNSISRRTMELYFSTNLYYLSYNSDFYCKMWCWSKLVHSINWHDYMTQLINLLSYHGLQLKMFLHFGQVTVMEPLSIGTRSLVWHCSHSITLWSTSSSILALSNPTTTSSPIRNAGTPRIFLRASSWLASISTLTSFSTKLIRFCERNSFAGLQWGQVLEVNMVTFFNGFSPFFVLNLQRGFNDNRPLFQLFGN